MPGPPLRFCRLRHCLERRRLSPPRVTWSSLGTCPFMSEPLLCIKIIRKHPFSKYDHILGSCRLGLNIFVGSTIQPYDVKPSVPGPTYPTSSPPGTGSGPGSPWARPLPKPASPFRGLRSFLLPLPVVTSPPGAPPLGQHLNTLKSSLSKNCITFLSVAPLGPPSRLPTSPPGHVEQPDPSPAPVRSRPRLPSSSASPARSRCHSRSLTGCRPSHVTERRAPPGIVLLPAPRHALFAGSFFSGKAGFPSLFMLKSSRTPLIFTVNQFPKYFHLHWWFL